MEMKILELLRVYLRAKKEKNTRWIFWQVAKKRVEKAEKKLREAEEEYKKSEMNVKEVLKEFKEFLN